MKILSLFLSVCILSGCKQATEEIVETPARLVKTHTIEDTLAPAEMQLVATVGAPQQVELAFEIEGPLTQLDVRAGTDVSKGQRLAQLDTDALTLALERAEAELDVARLALERIKPMHAKRLASDALLDETEARHTLATIAVADAQRQLADATLYSPWDAKIIERHVDNFAFVKRGQPVLTVAPVGDLEVITYVPEDLILPLLRSGLTQAEVSFNVDPTRRWPLRLREYTANASKVTRAFKLRFDLQAQPDWPLLPGMTASIYLSTDTGTEASLNIPTDGLYSGSDGSFHVWRVVDGHLEQVAVVTKAIRPNEVSIDGDLNIGDEIVIAGSGLEAGMRVVTTSTPVRQ